MRCVGSGLWVCWWGGGGGGEAQENLTNDWIVKMVKAGLREDVIVNVIGLEPGKYSLSPDDLIALKNANVSPRVITAMMNRSQSGATTSPPPAAVPPVAQASQIPSVDEIGVYYKKGDKWADVQPEVVNWKTGGVLKRIGTAGILKGDVDRRLQGPPSPQTRGSSLGLPVSTPRGAALTQSTVLQPSR